MKRVLMFLIVTLTVTNLFAQNEITSDSLDNKIKAHFEEYRSELFRYGGLTYYGETVTVFEKGQIEKELNLFSEIKNSELINNPTNSVFALCHNILIHTPEEGKVFLKLLNKPTTNDDILGLLWVEMIFTGEFGEQLVLNNVESNDAKWSNTWSFFLRQNAIYESSIPRIEKIYSQTEDIEIKVNMISALMYISNPQTVNFIRGLLQIL